MTYNIKQFNTKEDYLTYRKEWKILYKTLSQEIRDTKNLVKNGMRNGDYMYREQWKREGLRSKATVMLVELSEAKENAQASYLHFKEQDEAKARSSNEHRELEAA